jgi:catabolite regulation protein CreA
MAEDKQQITYTFEDQIYDAHKFTDQGKVALASVARLNGVINRLTEQLNDAQAASLSYKQTINQQLDDEMLFEEQEEDAATSESTEI